jgi:hypothetical protein
MEFAAFSLEFGKDTIDSQLRKSEPIPVKDSELG